MIGEIDGEYRHDSRRNLLEWCLPVIDAKTKSGSLEFSIAGQPNDFFPVHVSFVSKKNYCNIQVWLLLLSGWLMKAMLQHGGLLAVARSWIQECQQAALAASAAQSLPVVLVVPSGIQVIPLGVC